MKCQHCSQHIRGAAQIEGDLVLHAECAKQYHSAKNGRPYKCPVCCGSGVEYDREVLTTESFDPSDGRDGWGGPLRQRAVSRRERKDCELCNGIGFMAKEPTPIMQPAQEAKVIGWKK